MAVKVGDVLKDVLRRQGISPQPTASAKPKEYPVFSIPSRRLKRIILSIKKRRNLNWTDCRVLYLLTLMERRYGHANVFPSQAWIAKKVGKTRRHIIRIINKLKKLGLIIVRGVSKYRTLLYNLSFLTFAKQMLRAFKEQEKFFSNKNVTYIRNNIIITNKNKEGNYLFKKSKENSSKGRVQNRSRELLLERMRRKRNLVREFDTLLNS